MYILTATEINIFKNPLNVIQKSVYICVISLSKCNTSIKEYENWGKTQNVAQVSFNNQAVQLSGRPSAMMVDMSDGCRKEGPGMSFLHTLRLLDVAQSVAVFSTHRPGVR